jgi:hypothetical protein
MNALLRKNRILKYLALIVFCMEFLTPVFFDAPPYESVEDQCQTHFQGHQQVSASLASLFTEENTNEEERESGRSKEQALVYHCEFSFSFLKQIESSTCTIPVITQNELHRANFPLYQFHCLLLI